MEDNELKYLSSVKDDQVDPILNGIKADVCQRIDKGQPVSVKLTMGSSRFYKSCKGDTYEYTGQYPYSEYIGDKAAIGIDTDETLIGVRDSDLRKFYHMRIYDMGDSLHPDSIEVNIRISYGKKIIHYITIGKQISYNKYYIRIMENPGSDRSKMYYYASRNWNQIDSIYWILEFERISENYSPICNLKSSTLFLRDPELRAEFSRLYDICMEEYEIRDFQAKEIKLRNLLGFGKPWPELDYNVVPMNYCSNPSFFKPTPEESEALGLDKSEDTRVEAVEVTRASKVAIDSNKRVIRYNKDKDNSLAYNICLDVGYDTRCTLTHTIDFFRIERRIFKYDSMKGHKTDTFDTEYEIKVSSLCRKSQKPFIIYPSRDDFYYWLAYVSALQVGGDYDDYIIPDTGFLKGRAKDITFDKYKFFFRSAYYNMKAYDIGKEGDKNVERHLEENSEMVREFKMYLKGFRIQLDEFI